MFGSKGYFELFFLPIYLDPTNFSSCRILCSAVASVWLLCSAQPSLSCCCAVRLRCCAALLCAMLLCCAAPCLPYTFPCIYTSHVYILIEHVYTYYLITKITFVHTHVSLGSRNIQVMFSHKHTRPS